MPFIDITNKKQELGIKLPKVLAEFTALQNLFIIQNWPNHCITPNKKRYTQNVEKT